MNYSKFANVNKLRNMIGIIRTVLPAALLAAANPVFAATLTVSAYDFKGRLLDEAALAAFIGRADRKPADPSPADIAAYPIDGMAGFERAKISSTKKRTTIKWSARWPAQLSLVWPIAEDGFSNVWIDKDGSGFTGGESILLNEEIARTQFRIFKEEWIKRTKDWDPTYKPGAKALKLESRAREMMSAANALKDEPQRAAAFDKALAAISSAGQKMLVEHGAQVARSPKLKDSLRFGLTLDDSLGSRIENYKWVVDSIARSGANWVRLVFPSNPSDFLYTRPRSFTVYDPIIDALKERNIKIMGTVLDTAQWPTDLTPDLYVQRTRNLVYHYSGKIRSWEVGSEINGDWLGGTKTPLGLDKAFKIAVAGAKTVKSVDASLETVASLYWWDATAPDERHSLFGWLRRYAPQGFGADLDVVALSFQPEDNPVGIAFGGIFEKVHDALPSQQLMLGSYGFVEKKDLAGYWWLDPNDIDGARKDLLVYYTPASCAGLKSACGGFFWQTLDQMLPPSRKATDLYYVYRRALDELGR